jgi:hypothetical protein
MAKRKRPHRYQAGQAVHVPAHGMHGYIVAPSGHTEDGEPLYLLRHVDGGGIERESALEPEPIEPTPPPDGSA